MDEPVALSIEKAGEESGESGVTYVRPDHFFDFLIFFLGMLGRGYL